MPALDVDTSSVSVRDACLQLSVEKFLFAEADILDEWRWDDWLKMLSREIQYVCVNRPSIYHLDVRRGSRDYRTESAIFDETYDSLSLRVAQLNTEWHWAENPGSRTRHLVTNVLVTEGSDSGDISVTSTFFLYRSRLERDIDLFVGKRHDILRRSETGQSWQLARRRIVLDMSTILSSNISTFL